MDDWDISDNNKLNITIALMWDYCRKNRFENFIANEIEEIIQLICIATYLYFWKDRSVDRGWVNGVQSVWVPRSIIAIQYSVMKRK